MIKCEHMEEPNRRDLYFWYPNGDEAGYLCAECATEAGFCPGCGAFVAGIDSEIPAMQDYGMCGQCVDELRIETGEYNEDEY